jgi:hypothetical protein
MVSKFLGLICVCGSSVKVSPLKQEIIDEVQESIEDLRDKKVALVFKKASVNLKNL